MVDFLQNSHASNDLFKLQIVLFVINLKQFFLHYKINAWAKERRLYLKVGVYQTNIEIGFPKIWQLLNER